MGGILGVRRRLQALQGEAKRHRKGNNLPVAAAIYTVSQKNCADLFLSELGQISTVF